jgi:branched-chain amino acid transport system permease protein
MTAAAASPVRQIAWAALLQDAAIAALVALALALPLVGFRMVEVSGGLVLKPRLAWVAAAVAAVFVGRLALRLGLALRRERGTARRRPRLVAAAAWLERHQRPLVIAGLVLVAALPFLPFSSRYALSVAILVAIYVMLGWGLNIVVGLAGLLDLGYVAFYAVGAYTFALTAHGLGLSFWEALPLAGLCAAAFGFVLGFPVLRLRGD